MFDFLKRSRPAMTDKWGIFNGRAQIGAHDCHLGLVEAKTRRAAMREAKRLWPKFSLHISQINQSTLTEATAGFD